MLRILSKIAAVISPSLSTKMVYTILWYVEVIVLLSISLRKMKVLFCKKRVFYATQTSKINSICYYEVKRMQRPRTGTNMLGEPSPTVLKRNRGIRSIPHHLCVGHRYMLTREPRRILNLRSSGSPILSIYELFCIGVRKSFCTAVKICIVAL